MDQHHFKETPMPNSYLNGHSITSNGQVSTSQKLNYKVNLLRPQFLSNTNKAISNQDSTTSYHSTLSQLVLFLLYHTFLATQTHPQIQNPINPIPLYIFLPAKQSHLRKKSPPPPHNQTKYNHITKSSFATKIEKTKEGKIWLTIPLHQMGK